MSRRKQTTKANSGSPTIGEPEYLLVGKLRRPHGLAGEMLMEVATDFPERLRSGVEVFLGGQHVAVTIAAVRQHAKGLLIQFEDVKDRELAGGYRNESVWVRTEDRPALAEGTYYHHQLLGCRVLDEEGRPMGELVEIIETGANDVYVVQAENGDETLLPVIKDVVLAVDTGTRTVVARLPAGTDQES